MQKTMLGKIRIAPGQVGYYDEYSGIYLNLSNPEAVIYSGMNLYQIKKSVKSGRLRLIEGTLTEKTEGEKVHSEGNTSVIIKAKMEEPVAGAEDTVVEKEQTATVTENVTEEPVVEKPKRSRRKRKTDEITEPVEQVAEESALEEAIE